MIGYGPTVNARSPWARRARKTFDSVIELEILPGSEGIPVLVRSRGTASLRADRRLSQRPSVERRPSWPLASIGRISLPPRPASSAAGD